MINVDLYDSEFSYGFDFKFIDEKSLLEFIKLNPRFEIENVRNIEE